MKIALLLILFACVTCLCGEGSRVSERVFGERDRAAVVDRSTKVEACILRVVDPSHGSDMNKRVFVEGNFKVLREEMATLIIWKLLDERSYAWDALPACIPTYNARVRFTSGERTVDVDFCFGCSVILVREHGKPVGAGYFAQGSDWIFRAMASEFPRDSTIRKLKKQREERETTLLEVEMAKARDARKKG